jgi:hypothetical protein
MPQHIADTLNGEADADKIVKDVNRMLQGMGLFAPQAASAAALSNAGKDLYEFTKPLWKKLPDLMEKMDGGWKDQRVKQDEE